MKKHIPLYSSLIIFTLMFIFMIASQTIEKAVTFSAIDDGLYYPKIALNFIKLGKITYDGITYTNGFHPLWLIIIIPIYILFTAPLTALKIIYLISFALTIASILIFWKINNTLKLSTLSFFVGLTIVFLNIRFFTLWFSFLESPLVLFIYLLILLFLTKYHDQILSKKKYAFYLGVIIAIAFYSRTDSFFLLFAYGLILFSANKNSYKKAMKLFFTTSITSGLLVIPYLTINYLYFGHFSTVSSWVKLSSPSFQNVVHAFNNFDTLFMQRIFYVLNINTSLKPFFYAGSIILIMLTIFYTYSDKSILKKLEQFYSLYKLFIIFSILHLLFTLFFTPSEALFSIWFYVSEILVMGIMFGIILYNIQKKIISFFFYLLIFSILFAQFYFYDNFIDKKKMTTAKIEMANFINNNFANKNFMGIMFDSGIVSYFSNKNFISLNGLIGNFEIAQLCKNHKYNLLIQKYNVEYCVWDFPEHKEYLIRNNLIYKTETKTVFNNFAEGVKSFYLFKLSNLNFEDILSKRYN